VKVFLAGVFPCGAKLKGSISREMNVYLAGLSSEKNRANSNNQFAQKIHVLESFHYIQEWMLPYIKNDWNFMLDSGAFTFFGKGGNVDWVNYIRKYAQFINNNKINLFFELDLDNLIGIERTRDLRKLLEDLTGKQPIPVWRPFRGVGYWHEMIRDYDYVAISASGAYDSAWTRKDNAIPVLGKLLKQAHEQGTKVHGLGYTKLDGLIKLPWDSVDSTAWIYGNRGGFLYRFNGKTIDKIKKPEGTRLNAKAAAIHNFKEWVKFQKYADANL